MQEKAACSMFCSRIRHSIIRFCIYWQDVRPLCRQEDARWDEEEEEEKERIREALSSRTVCWERAIFDCRRLRHKARISVAKSKEHRGWCSMGAASSLTEVVLIPQSWPVSSFGFSGGGVGFHSISSKWCKVPAIALERCCFSG